MERRPRFRCLCLRGSEPPPPKPLFHHLDRVRCGRPGPSAWLSHRSPRGRRDLARARLPAGGTLHPPARQTDGPDRLTSLHPAKRHRAHLGMGKQPFPRWRRTVSHSVRGNLAGISIPVWGMVLVAGRRVPYYLVARDSLVRAARRFDISCRCFSCRPPMASAFRCSSRWTQSAVARRFHHGLHLVQRWAVDRRLTPDTCRSPSAFSPTCIFFKQHHSRLSFDLLEWVYLRTKVQINRGERRDWIVRMDRFVLGEVDRKTAKLVPFHLPDFHVEAVRSD